MDNFALLKFLIVLWSTCGQVVSVIPTTNGVTYYWKSRPWSSCFSPLKCGEGLRVRKVSCHDSSGFAVAESNCEASGKPSTVQPCFRVCDLHKHVLRWHIGEWSRCVPFEKPVSCVGTSVAGVARRNVTCVLEPSGLDVGPTACKNFWDMPEEDMLCSVDIGTMVECPQDCVTMQRNISCPPHTCPSKNKWKIEYREVTEVVVAPSKGGSPCSSTDATPVCPNAHPAEDCRDSKDGKKRYMLKIGEWGPCQQHPSFEASASEVKVQISLRPVVGISRRNITCITDNGVSTSLSLCNVVQAPPLERRCIVPTHCLTSPWSEWRVKHEGCITSDGKVYAEVRTRVRRVVQMPVGAGADPCPPLFEERSVFQDLPSCYKYQWLPLEWSECELRVHGHHGEVNVVRPTCGSGLQYRNLACVRASDLSPVPDDSACREQRPPTLQRCHVSCRRDCQVSHWARWGPCTFFKGHDPVETMKDGYRRRVRSVVVSPSNGGAPCPHLEEADRCQDVEQFMWRYGEWSNCTLDNQQAACGPGNKTRNKTCVKIGGARLDDLLCDRHHDQGDLESCVVPCPDDCVLSEWSEWSKCSLACHTGTKQGEKFRNRTLLAIAGKDGTCELKKRDRTEWTHCNENYCEPFRWTAGAWGQCRPPVEGGCGPGVQTRRVECTHGREDAVEFELCNYMKVPKTEQECHVPCPVDCVMSNFSDWSPCEGTCDTESAQSRYRIVLQSPVHGGAPCPESLLEERTCTPDTDCFRKRSSGGKGLEHRWHATTWAECTLPGTGQKCGMGFQVRNVSCLGVEGREVEPYFCLSRAARTPPAIAVRSCEVTCSTGCVLTSWTAWTQCGHSYDATRTRTRELVGPVSEKEKCRSTFKLLEKEKCPSADAGNEPQDMHWMSCIVEDTNTSYSGQTCGDGYRYKMANTGSGPGLERDFCWQDCPIDCQMSGWTEWSECDVPCGLGFRERRRDVLVPPNHLGRPCPEGVNKTEIQRDVCHIVCADFHWLAGGWSVCAVNKEIAKCGKGTQYRTVQCLDKRTEQEVNESKCDPLEKPESVSNCTLHCPGECVMSPWKVTLKCQEPCSPSSYQEQRRSVLRQPHPSSAPCPSETVLRAPCVLNLTCHSHSLSVGPWGSCVLPQGALCGVGVQNAPLACVRSDGRLVDAVQCEKTHQSLSLKEPTSKPCYVDCPVDCVMSQWSAWNTTQCVACGNGMAMRRTRFILQSSSDGGRPCPSEILQLMPCPFKACYHWKHSDWSACDLESADCGYGVRRRVVDCIRYDGLRVDRSFCLKLNVTFDVGGWLDPAWLAMAQENSQEEEICHIPCPGACVLTEWSRWSHCHKNCRIGQSVGYQTSSRRVMSSPQNATEPCSRQLLRTKPCWSNDCNFFRWKLKNGTLICVGKDGIPVQGGCASEPPPCEHWCEKLGGSCSGGLCRCQGRGAPLVTGPTAAPCSSGPRPPANHSASTPEIKLKYYPDDNQASFWMYAMISIGTAFVIFVAVTVYLMCRSSLRQRLTSVERQPSMRRRVHTSKHSSNCSNISTDHRQPN